MAYKTRAAGIKAYSLTAAGKAAHKRAMAKHRASQQGKDYEASSARKASRAAYSTSPKGKAAHNRAYKKYAVKRRATSEGVLKTKARDAVHSALRSGWIAKLPCQVCGVTKHIQAHHPDYTKPLVVQWLCRLHHKQEDKLCQQSQTPLH